MIIAAVGLERERRIVDGPGVEAIAGGGDKARLEAMLEARVASAHGIISIGIAGGLAPRLRTGDWVLADGVNGTPTDTEWTSRLAARLPEAARGPLLGVDSVVASSAEKANLHHTTGALAVDMESHIVAEAAERHRVPLAAIRVVVDPVERTIPRSALAGSRADGTIDPIAVMRSLARYPRDLIGLIRLSLDTRAARATLVRGRDLLGPGLGLLDTHFVPKGALALKADPAPADA